MGPSITLDPPPAAPIATRPRDRLAAHALATDIARLHGDALLRTARRYVHDPADAHDAYQRALELLLEHATQIDRAKAVNWMHVVVRREAAAIARHQDRHLPLIVDEIDKRNADDQTDDQLERIDLAQRAGEALATLKETEAQALCLRAQGLSYEEIAETYGWSYTKVNRAVSEGRKAFIDHYLGAERGDVCAEAAPRIGAYLAGDLRTRDQLRLRAHLTRCSACRADLHAQRGATEALQALLPPTTLAATNTSWLHDHLLAPLGDLAARLTPASDHLLTTKLSVAAVSVAAVTGGGITLDHQLDTPPPPPALRAALTTGAPTNANTTTNAPATAAVTTATTTGARIAETARTRAAAAAAKRRAAARRKAAAARKTAARTAAAREFSPATREFAGTSQTTSTNGARTATSTATTTEAATGAQTTSDAPAAEVPLDTSSSDPGIAVTDETTAP